MNLVCSLLGCSLWFFATYLYLLKALHLLLKCREMHIYVSYFAIQSAFILKLVIIATQRSSSFILTAQCVYGFLSL